MHIETKELRMIESAEEMEKALKDGLIPVPKQLMGEAFKELGNKKNTIVKNSKPLLSWARNQKRKQSRRRRKYSKK